MDNELYFEEVRDLPTFFAFVVVTATIGVFVCSLLQKRDMHPVKSMVKLFENRIIREKSEAQDLKDLESWRHIRDRIRQKRRELQESNTCFTEENLVDLKEFCLSVENAVCASILLGMMIYLSAAENAPKPKGYLQSFCDTIADIFFLILKALYIV